MTLDAIKTPLCPTCNQPPAIILAGGHQAWCGNELGCNVLTWDMYLDAETLRRTGYMVNWPPAPEDTP
jgi:hypothetical protein